MSSKGKAIGVLLRELSEDTIPNKRTFKDLEVSQSAGAEGEATLDFEGDLAYTADGKLAVSWGAKVDLNTTGAVADAEAETDGGAHLQRVNTTSGKIRVTSRVKWHFTSDGKKGLLGNR